MDSDEEDCHGELLVLAHMEHDGSHDPMREITALRNGARRLLLHLWERLRDLQTFSGDHCDREAEPGHCVASEHPRFSSGWCGNNPASTPGYWRSVA